MFHLSKCRTSCFILFLPLDTHQVSQENNGKINFCQCFMSSNVLRVRQPHISVTSCSLGVTLLFHYLMTMVGQLGHPILLTLPESFNFFSHQTLFMHRLTAQQWRGRAAGANPQPVGCC